MKTDICRTTEYQLLFINLCKLKTTFNIVYIQKTYIITIVRSQNRPLYIQQNETTVSLSIKTRLLTL